MKKKLTAVDLFCGAGGTSTGLSRACDALQLDLDLLAINHWSRAIQTHTLNHPSAKHLCEGLDSLNPRQLVKGKLNLLVASPECTHHSIARGGRPINDQSRASAWHVVRWAEALQPDNILIENVKEFTTWGPIGCDNRPLKSKTGDTFHAFLNALRSLGYAVDFRVFNAADYGDVTTRERLVIQARRGMRKISWPVQTHSRNGVADLFNSYEAWRPAKEVIDWSLKGKSIFHRKKPLAPATLRRIEAGITKFGASNAEPFLVILRNHSNPLSLNQPLPTITAGGTHIGLCEPFLVKFNGTGVAYSVNQPLDTITTKDRFGLVQINGENYHLDITFRMLQPHELARAMSFGDSYQFTGSRTEMVKQIGNAVPVGMAQALCHELLSTDTAIMQKAA